MSWYSVWAFLFFIPILVVAIWVWLRRKNKTASLKFSGLEGLKKIQPSLRARLSRLPFFLKTLALCLTVVALARPREADVKVKRNVEGIDIMVALDISDSMLIEDMKPKNRLEASKKIIKDFIEKRISDRIGLVVFSGEAYTRVPLTLDYPLLLESLSEVKTTRTIKMGTAIGVALASSVGRLKDSTAESQIVIFLTDGENNSGTIDPETALQVAVENNIKIYSIGMGKDGQAQLPVYTTDALGRRHKRYRTMHSKVNQELLSMMAEETGGKFYRATNSRALERVFNEINKLEKTKIEANQYTKYNERFSKFLMWALGLYLLSLFFEKGLLRRGP